MKSQILKKLTDYGWWIPAGIAGLALIVVYYTGLVSHWDFKLVATEVMGMTNAHVWGNLLKGRWDVDPNINIELFLRDGKYYVYFGLFPSLVRGVLTLFYDIDTSIPRLSELLALLVLGVAHVLTGLQLKLHEGVTRRYFFAFMAVLLLGSPFLYVTSPAFPYHEVILWGSALLALFNWQVLRFLDNSGVRPVLQLVLMGVTAGAALLSRVSLALPAFIVLAFFGAILLVPKITPVKSKFSQVYFAKMPSLSLKQFILVALSWVLAGGSLLYVNYKRFGNPFAITPIEYHVAYNTSPGNPNERGAAFTKFGFWRWDRIPTNIEYYFVPHADNFSENFPFLVLGNTLESRSFAEHFDNVEFGTHMPLSLTAPLFLWLSILAFHLLGGTQVSERRRLMKALVYCGFATWLFLLGFGGLCLRYSIDLMSALVFASFVAIALLKSDRPQWLEKRKFFMAFVFVSALSIYGTWAAYLTYVVNDPAIPYGERIEFYQKLFLPFTSQGRK